MICSIRLVGGSASMYETVVSAPVANCSRKKMLDSKPDARASMAASGRASSITATPGRAWAIAGLLVGIEA